LPTGKSAGKTGISTTPNQTPGPLKGRIAVKKGNDSYKCKKII